MPCMAKHPLSCREIQGKYDQMKLNMGTYMQIKVHMEIYTQIRFNIGKNAILGPNKSRQTKWGQIMALLNFSFGQFFMWIVANSDI